jgi:hypothetical protein
MAQAAVLDGEFLDLCPRLEDGLAAAEGDIGGCQVAKALVIVGSEQPHETVTFATVGGEHEKALRS